MLNALDGSFRHSVLSLLPHETVRGWFGLNLEAVQHPAASPRRLVLGLIQDDVTMNSQAKKITCDLFCYPIDPGSILWYHVCNCVLRLLVAPDQDYSKVASLSIPWKQ